MFRKATRVTALAGAAVLAIGLPVAQAATADAAAKGRVIAKTQLSSRSAPSIHVGKVGSYKRGTVINIDCKLNGTNVDGNQRWYKISGKKDAWVSARYVENIGAAPGWCDNPDYGNSRAKENVIIRQGPSTKDRKIGTLRGNTWVSTSWVVGRGASVSGNSNWIAIRTKSGNRGWVSQAYVEGPYN